MSDQRRAFSLHRQQRVGDMHLAFIGATWLAQQVKRASLSVPARLQEKLAECRMGGVGSSAGKHRLEYRNQGQSSIVV